METVAGHRGVGRIHSVVICQLVFLIETDDSLGYFEERLFDTCERPRGRGGRDHIISMPLLYYIMKITGVLNPRWFHYVHTSVTT